MIKFNVTSRFSKLIAFTAEIDATDDTEMSVKLGLSVNWALKNGASLSGASLLGANLSGVDLSRTNLSGANLSGANLSGASLSGVDLSRANLLGASLLGANLSGASLLGANLLGANLLGANLSGANLSGANLSGVDLSRANGINDFIKCIQIETYPITYTDEVMQIGCERHKIADWRDFDSRRIADMDGKSALNFWAKYKDWIFQTIDLCPAKPTASEATQ